MPWIAIGERLPPGPVEFESVDAYLEHLREGYGLEPILSQGQEGGADVLRDLSGRVVLRWEEPPLDAPRSDVTIGRNKEGDDANEGT